MVAPSAAEAFPFADGDAGKLLTFAAGAPAVGDWDILCITSNTVVQSVSSTGGASWTQLEAAVANQGAYIYGRQATGGEPATVVVDTNNNHDTVVGWVRVPGVDAIDAPPTSSTQANASVGGSTPAHSTGGITAAGSFIVAFGALHSTQSANQSAPNWSSGYTGVLNTAQGSGATGVRCLVAYRDNVGTAAETPQVSWSGDGIFDRYMLTVVLTVSAVAADGTLAGTLPALVGAFTGDVVIDGVMAGSLPALVGALAGDEVLDGELIGTLPAVVGALAGDERIDGSLDGTLAALTGALYDTVATEPGQLIASGRAASTLTAGGRP